MIEDSLACVRPSVGSLVGVMESEQVGNHAYVLNFQIHAAELNTAGSFLGLLKNIHKNSELKKSSYLKQVFCSFFVFWAQSNVAQCLFLAIFWETFMVPRIEPGLTACNETPYFLY